VARGWESKSVEEQIQSARERDGTGRPKATTQQLEVERKRDSLLLQRRRVLHDLEIGPNGRLRQTLESGLDYLNAQIALLEPES
jgi:hypothetical protein